jgi:hypothetical protein
VKALSPKLFCWQQTDRCETFCRSYLVDPDFINKEFEDAGVPFEKDIVPFIPESSALTKKVLQQY